MAGAKKIFLVEDDSDIASLLQLSLKDEGYEIIHEADGARAVELLEKHVIKRGNQILVYEISSLKKQGRFIKSLEINKFPITLKSKKSIKYGKIPKRAEIIKDFL